MHDYILKTLKEAHMDNSNPQATPLPTRTTYVPAKTDAEILEDVPYLPILGKLL